jgi:TonB family protein
MRAGLLAFAVAACAMAAPAQRAAAQVPQSWPPPPLLPSVPLPGLAERYAVPNAVIARFRADPPRCGDEDVRPVHAEEPFPSGFIVPPERIGEASAVLSFRIDAGGRVLSISEPRTEGETRADLGDLAPVLASWRFPSRRARRTCSIRFRIVAVPLERADTETLYRFVASHGHERPPALPLASAAFARLMPQRSNCMPAPPPLKSPPLDTSRLAQPAGSSVWTVLTYDLDAGGVPVGARVVASSGNERFHRRSLANIRRSSFRSGIRSGCLRYFYNFSPLPSDEIPARPFALSSGRNCPAERDLLAALPRPLPPPAFRARPVGGWVALRYDVLEGGAVGNAEVLAAEPAAAFGQEALRLAAGARVPGAAPAAGCVAIVRFPLVVRVVPARLRI